MRLTDATGSERCATCGMVFDPECMQYHRAFDARCGAEKWVGAVEL